jgi:Fe-S cluster assembly scaffold protein SufB
MLTGHAGDVESVARRASRLAYNGAMSWGVLQVNPSATGARNYSQCDSMLIGDQVGVDASSCLRILAFQLRSVPVLKAHRPC